MAAKRKKGKKKAASGKGGSPFLRGVVSILILAALVGAALFLAQKYIPAGKEAGRPSVSRPADDKTTAPEKTQAREDSGRGPSEVRTEGAKPEKPAEKASSEKPGPEALKPSQKPNLPEPAETAEKDKPLLAVIIDDLGYKADIDKKFVRFPAPLTLAVMPHSPGAKNIANSGHEAGKVILAHVPMEPLGYPEEDPGTGALLTSMDADTLVAALREGVARVPHAAGVNNHMGSRLTQEAQSLLPLFTALKKDGLFFVDSVTSPQSRAGAVAGLLSLPFARRDVFLDHTKSKADVTVQLLRAVSLAAKNGKAVAIGHPHPVTYEVLTEMLGEIKRQVRIVPVTEIVK
ncbi:MAG: divergent polysaccharide deacetylase family protein [Deltaproteobacteria bacterium]|nr:divergent polysaccharide deacetylase family protein [Deltaproteobacteria bacterium]